MKILVTLLIAVVLSVSGFAAAATEVSGTWDLEMNWSSDARSTGTCEFRQDGDKLTGTCGGDDRFPISGQVQNNELWWEFEVKQDGSLGRMEFAGELDDQGTTIKGSCSIVGGQGGTFTMKKKQS